MVKARTCAKCGSANVKVYPDDFPSSRWPFRFIPIRVSMAGGPDSSRPILVCTDCGHNEDWSRRLP